MLLRYCLPWVLLLLMQQLRLGAYCPHVVIATIVLTRRQSKPPEKKDGMVWQKQSFYQKIYAHQHCTHSTERVKKKNTDAKAI
jgi:hypothetical protein